MATYLINLSNWARPPDRVHTPRPGARQAPTLVIWGQRDRYLGPELAEPDRDDVPNLDRVVRLPNALHWVHHEEPERVTQLLIHSSPPPVQPKLAKGRRRSHSTGLPSVGPGVQDGAAQTNVGRSRMIPARARAATRAAHEPERQRGRRGPGTSANQSRRPLAEKAATTARTSAMDERR
jgi:hypothetical protein